MSRRFAAAEFWRTVDRFLVLGSSLSWSPYWEWMGTGEVVGVFGNGLTTAGCFIVFDDLQLLFKTGPFKSGGWWASYMKSEESCAFVKDFVRLTKVPRRSDEVRNEPELLKEKQKSHKTRGGHNIRQRWCRKWIRGEEAAVSVFLFVASVLCECSSDIIQRKSSRTPINGYHPKWNPALLKAAFCSRNSSFGSCRMFVFVPLFWDKLPVNRLTLFFHQGPGASGSWLAHLWLIWI